MTLPLLYKMILFMMCIVLKANYKMTIVNVYAYLDLAHFYDVRQSDHFLLCIGLIM